MAHESPLFQSALELLGHSITHFNGGTELDRKLVILHLANAVELILKDLMLDRGMSIYKNPKETITLHGAVAELRREELELPAFHKIELMIDERNALQHRFGSPNELTTLFYTETATEFFRGLLETHYSLDLDEVLPQFVPERELAAFRLRRPTNESELDNLKKVAAVHPAGALLAAYSYFERLVRNFIETVAEDKRAGFRPPGMISHRLLEGFGVELPDSLVEKLSEVRHLRNVVAHGRREPTRKEVSKAVAAIEKLEANLDELSTPEELQAIRERWRRLQEAREQLRRDEALRVFKGRALAQPKAEDEPTSKSSGASVPGTSENVSSEGPRK